MIMVSYQLLNKLTTRSRLHREPSVYVFSPLASRGKGVGLASEMTKN